MKTVHKFPLQVMPTEVVMMPEFAQVLTVQVQGDQPCLWAVVNTERPLVERNFHWRATGVSCAEAGTYVGTIQLGILVFHLFDPET